MSDQKITWMQPHGLICLLIRIMGGQAWRETKTCVFAVTVCFMAVWLFFRLLALSHPEIETMNPIEAPLFSMLCGLLFACLYQLRCLEPSQVVLDDMAIVIRERFRRRYYYDQIAGIRFDTVRWRTITVRIMLMARRDGRDIIFGIPPSLDLSQVADFLKSKCVEVVDATPPAHDPAQTHTVSETPRETGLSAEISEPIELLKSEDLPLSH